jgi:hypothetical protein
MTIKTFLNSDMSVAYITDCATCQLRHQSCHFYSTFIYRCQKVVRLRCVFFYTRRNFNKPKKMVFLHLLNAICGEGAAPPPPPGGRRARAREAEGTGQVGEGC